MIPTVKLYMLLKQCHDTEHREDYSTNKYYYNIYFYD